MNLGPMLFGLGFAGGLVLIADGWRRRSPTTPDRPRRTWTPADRNRALTAAAGGIAVAVVTRWPAAAVLAGAGIWALPRVLGPDRDHRVEVARIEAVATWTELLRDTLSSAAGLEQAITATAPVAPEPVRDAVQRLADAIRRGVRLPEALDGFAADLADPIGDLVARALKQATGFHGGQLTDCLTSLAGTARGQAALRVRVATSRAGTRTAARVITGTTVAMVVGLVLLNRGFLDPYRSVTGQLVLLAVGGLFTGGFVWLHRAARILPPPRILAGPDARRPA